MNSLCITQSQFSFVAYVVRFILVMFIIQKWVQNPFLISIQNIGVFVMDLLV